MYCCKTLITLNRYNTTLYDEVLCDVFVPVSLNDTNPQVTFRFKQIESIFNYTKRKKSSPYEVVLKEVTCNISMNQQAIKFVDNEISLLDEFKSSVFEMYIKMLPNILTDKSNNIEVRREKLLAPDIDKLVKILSNKFIEVDKSTIIKNISNPYNK